MQVVVFDFFGVIAQPRNIYSAIAEILKIKDDRIRPLYNAYESGALTRTGFWKKLGVEDYAEIEKRTAKRFTLDPDFKSVHSELKKTYTTAILSNCNTALLHALTKRFGLEESFEAVVVSEEAKSMKPDHKIYRALLAELDVNAKECVFVDDRLENLKAAHELGMTTVFHLVQPENSGYKPDYTIDDLNELIEIMEGL